MKLIYLKSALKCDSFDVAIGTQIPFFRVLVSIEPGRSLLQFVTTNCLITSLRGVLLLLPVVSLLTLELYDLTNCMHKLPVPNCVPCEQDRIPLLTPSKEGLTDI